MKLALRLEEAAEFGLALWLFAGLDVAWWWFPLLLLAPDLGMVGYLVNTRVGALTYNLVHHKGTAILLIIGGALIGVTWLQVAGLIMLAHSAMDRALGYGLKYPDNFKHTHLGWLGGAQREAA